jgi:hypothetical protein
LGDAFSICWECVDEKVGREFFKLRHSKSPKPACVDYYFRLANANEFGALWILDPARPVDRPTVVSYYPTVQRTGSGAFTHATHTNDGLPPLPEPAAPSLSRIARGAR